MTGDGSLGIFNETALSLFEASITWDSYSFHPKSIAATRIKGKNGISLSIVSD